MAPAKSAPGSPSATAPNATPTASPSGILCKVIASTNKTVLFQLVFTPSDFSNGSFKCKCGKIWSNPKRKKAPNKKPILTGTHAIDAPHVASAISTAGFSKLQKLAASITPAVKPSKVSIKPLFTSLMKKTREAPKAVTNHVNKDPVSPCIMGVNPSK